MPKNRAEAPRPNKLQMLRMSPEMVGRLDAIGELMSADPKNQGRQVRYTDVMRQAIDIGCDELERRWSK